MKHSVDLGAIEQLNFSLESRRAVAREAYEAYEFDARIETGTDERFFFMMHDGQPTMARRIVMFPDGGPAKLAHFCVSFEEGTSIIRDAFAFSGKNYFGRLPDGFIPEFHPEAEEDETPALRMM